MTMSRGRWPSPTKRSRRCGLGPANAMGASTMAVGRGDPPPGQEKQSRSRTPRFLLVLALCVFSAASGTEAQDFPRYGDALYEPKLRQPGKDVMWLPTPDAVVTRMLQAAKTTDKDLVYDLGAGEGRIPIA